MNPASSASMPEPTIERVTSAVRLIDEHLSSGGHRGPLLALRNRIVGELTCDPDLVFGAMGEDFELVMFAAGAKSVVPRALVAQSLQGLTDSAGSSVVWVEIDDLLSGPTSVAINGRLCSLKKPDLVGRSDLGARDAVASSTPMAIFCRCEGSVMVAEVLHIGGDTETVDLHDVRFPPIDEIRVSISNP